MRAIIAITALLLMAGPTLADEAAPQPDPQAADQKAQGARVMDEIFRAAVQRTQITTVPHNPKPPQKHDDSRG